MAESDELFTLKTLRSSSVKTHKSSGSEIMENINEPIEPVLTTGLPALTDPLIEACQQGDLNKVKELINKDNINNGCLHHASGLNFFSIVQFLLDNDANPNLRIEPARATPILWAARNGHAYIVKLLIERGADPDVKDDMGFSLLHLAVQSSNIMLVVYVIHLGLAIDVFDAGCRTALHWAIAQGDHMSVKALLKAGANPNLPDGDNNYPLHLAVNNSASADVVAELLKNGAEPHVVTSWDPLPEPWVQGCSYAGKNIMGSNIKHRISKPTARLLVTLIPPAFLLVLLNLYSFTNSFFFTILLAGLLAYAAKRLATDLANVGWTSSRPIIESTIMSSFFTSVFTIIVYYYSVFLASVNWLSAVTFLLIIAIQISYLLTMKTDAGIVEPGSRENKLKTIERLMDDGLYDSVHFCTSTYAPIPTRGAYDHYLKMVICKYDHYCPWVNNAIGLKNHRFFIVFLLSLSLGLILVAVQIVHASKTPFLITLTIVTGIQALWIFLLTGVQLFQISRGVTSYEISHASSLDVYKTDPIKAFSSLPRDHPKADIILAHSKSKLNKIKHVCNRTRSRYTLCLKLFGIHQLQELNRKFKDTAWNKTDYGLNTNCMDFWHSGGSILHPNNRGRLGGVPIDYTRVQELHHHDRSIV